MESSIGQRVRRYRGLRGISASRLARTVGLTENAIRKLEAGDYKEPRFSVGLRIARALEIDPHIIAGLEPLEHSQTSTGPELASIIRALRSYKKRIVEQGIAHLDVFGSVARGEADAKSDVDVVVEPHRGVAFSLFDLLGVKEIVESAIGFPADVVTQKTLENAPFAGAAFEDAVRVF